jgi:D-serine deaminase-like pyridoxal phosphate-dependent protein
MHISELDTPALVIDLDIMERNLRTVADYAREHALRLRPHTKTHKVPAIGRKQLESGAAGLTVAKVSEAEVMVNSGTPDLLIAYPVIGEPKLRRLVDVAKKTNLRIAVDSVYAATQISDACHASGVEVGLLAETDAGFHRVGASPGEDLLNLAKTIQRLPGVRFEGVAFYPGHLRDARETGKQAIDTVARILGSILDDFCKAGIPVNIVSGGSTPSLYHSHEITGMNEIRPGTYVYNDLNTVLTGGCTLDDCAASILLTVVSTAVKGQMIVDGGSKTFSSDGLTNGDTFGRVVEAPGCRFHRMNEEHGFVDITRAERAFAIGDRVHIIPNHICAAVNLHERVYGVRDGEVEEIWRVEGRGKLQ